MTPVDLYISKQPEHCRGKLELVRQAISTALPEAEEGLSYGMPTYTIHDKPVIFFAGWKTFYSIYPLKDTLRAELTSDLYKAELGSLKFKLVNSTIQFSWEQPVPVELITRIAKFLAREARQSATT